MDVNLINPFIRSTKQVFADMIHISLTAGKPFLKPAEQRFHKLYRLSAVIGLEGSVHGQVVMSMSDQVSLAISSGLLSMPIDKINADCYDAIAELVNMITGGAKKDISAEIPISLSIPKIMLTENVKYLKSLPVLIIPFQTSAGKLILQITMDKPSDPAFPEPHYPDDEEREVA